MAEITGHIRAVIAGAAARRTREAGESLRAVVSRIEVVSVPNPRAGGPNPARLAARARFVPAVGEPIEVTIAAPGGPVAAALARARELSGDRTVNAVATALNAEGFTTAAGARWRRNAVARLLAAAAPPDGPPGGPGPPPRSPARRGRRAGRGA
jgi:hypothetical protein